MRRVALILLLNYSFMSAQTKTVVTTYGEKITIDPNGIGDNLGNHTATTTLNLNNNDISNVSTIFIKKEAQLFDKNTGNSNYFSLNKNNGIVGIYNSNTTGNALSINEVSSKTTFVTTQITKGTDGSLPQKDNVLISTDSNGNTAWLPLVKVKDALTFQFLNYSTGNSQYNTATFNDVPGLMVTYTAPVTGILSLQANLYTIIPDGVVTKTPTSVKTEMVLMVNGNQTIKGGASTITTATPSAFVNGGGNFPETTTILGQIPVTAGQTYTITVQARTADTTTATVGTCVGNYVHTEGVNSFSAYSTLMGTLFTD
ncbi:hypothetical protein SAMN05444388_108140 [Flavobacterium johnsoniae]|uniref:Uncharacterized protein n=2 Tax=Flavobacterium johnsoniae TaxID=986 RepID=A0A1M5RGI1_FLAJO|nr:hypothetical protein SAMN05444388_108140 [Flavobacterium johnsoniae]